MALTTGFKRFLGLSGAAIIIFGGGYVAQTKNYWGLLDKAPEAPKVEVQAEVQAPVRNVEAPVVIRQSEPEPQYQPAPMQEEETAPKRSTTLNKLKGLNKL